MPLILKNGTPAVPTITKQPIILFPKTQPSVSRTMISPKPPVTDAEIILSAPRIVESAVLDNNLKVSSTRLKQVRQTIGNLFADCKLSEEWLDSVKANQLMDSNIVNEKFGNYDAEFSRLHKTVQDTFRLAGRPDLADQFSITVPVFTSNQHPMDFIATLLKGASNPVSLASQNNQYAVLEPFKSLMQDVLISKGIAAPNDMATLTEIFYNTFIGGTNDATPKMSFDTMSPSTRYSADQALVDAVVGYVKDMANKKKAGEQLSTIQDKIANVGLKVESGLTKAATTQVNQEVGGVVVKQSKWIALGIGVVIIVLIYFMVKKG